MVFGTLVEMILQRVIEGQVYDVVWSGSMPLSQIEESVSTSAELIKMGSVFGFYDITCNYAKAEHYSEPTEPKGGASRT